MGWVTKLDVEPEDHHCDRPDLRPVQFGPITAGYGSVWECDECGSRWVVSRSLWGPVWTPEEGQQ